MGRPVDADGNEIFVEYPKALEDGRVVASAEEEAALDPPALPSDAPVIPEVLDDPDGAPPSPLDDVTIEMENPAFQPAKKATKKK